MKSILVILVFLFHFTWCYSQTWSNVGTGTNGTVETFLNDTSANLLYVGGQFTTASGISAKYIAQWNGLQWDSLGAGMNAIVYTLAIYNGELYAGGDFTIAGGNSTNHIAKWDGTNWMPVGSGMEESIFALAVYNGELYAGGNFVTAGGVPASYIAKWNGITWSSVDVGVDARVFTLIEYNGKLYAGGWFSNAGGNVVNGIAGWDGTNWSSLGMGTNSSVLALGVHNGKLYLGGGFTMADSIPANHIASWDGTSFDSLGAGVNNVVKSFATYNCELYAGGSFSIAGGVGANRIAKWNGTGWTPLGSGISNASGVFSLAEYNNDLYVGGTIFPPGTANIRKWYNPIPSAPNASFFTNDSTIQMGSYIQFTNTSTVGATVSWSFQGGIPTSSTALSPIVYYPNTGSYDVTLVTTSCSGIDTLDKFSYINVDSSIHVVPYGISSSFVNVIIYEDNNIDDSLPNFSAPFMYEVSYYKPLTYDSLTSPLLLIIHGLGGSGSNSIGNVQAIADRRNALIVAPTMQPNNQYLTLFDFAQDSNGCYHNYWIVNVVTQLYKDVLERENRTSVPVYLTGFSAGGQFVTRYMLFRQAIQDSIPIKMAVSISPFSYTFCTDSLNGIEMIYPCGLSPIYYSPNCGVPLYRPPLPFCNEHIQQYYNENYGVLIGTGDTIDFNPGWLCTDVQGADRYERAQNFYNFSTNDAIERGTTLQWQYDSVIDIDHSGYAMYNTKRNISDSSTIAETLLFETPYHTVPNLVPLANFTADTTIVNLPSATVQFYNGSTNTTNYLWDFGDSTTSTLVNPSHTYAYADTFTVTLTAISGSGCEDELVKQNYIIVTLPIGIESYDDDNSFGVYPNPANETVRFSYQLIGDIKSASINIHDAMGRKIQSLPLDKNTNSYLLNISALTKGFYFVTLIANNEIKANKKLLIVK